MSNLIDVGDTIRTTKGLRRSGGGGEWRMRVRKIQTAIDPMDTQYIGVRVLRCGRETSEMAVRAFQVIEETEVTKP